MDIDLGTAGAVVSALGLGTAFGALVKSRIKRAETTDTQLWAWVGRLQEEVRSERVKCDQRMVDVEQKADAAESRADAAERRADAAERRAEALAMELRAVRKEIGMTREDDTPLLGGRKPRREGDE